MQGAADLNNNLLDYFHRYQKVIKDWCPISKGVYILKEQPHIEDWDKQAKERKILKLQSLIQRGGSVFGAFDQSKLIGFSAIDGILLGINQQYIELVEFHVSYEYRGQHIGKQLFELSAEAARDLAAKKLYIVASSSEESQKVYKKLRCTYTTEYISCLYDQSPSDVHLEYKL